MSKRLFDPERQKETTSEVRLLEAAFKDFKSKVMEMREEMEWRRGEDEWQCRKSERQQMT